MVLPLTSVGEVPTFIQHVATGGEIVPPFFAGLWSSWRSKDRPNAEWQETSTILTREACPKLQVIHHRMLVILP